jgi:hypothetical protein
MVASSTSIAAVVLEAMITVVVWYERGNGCTRKRTSEGVTGGAVDVY